MKQDSGTGLGAGLDRNRINRILKPILWDYDIDPEVFFRVATGEIASIGWFNRVRALLRIFERLGWYDLLDLFGISEISKYLDPGIISKIRFPELKEKYEFAGKVLRGEPVPFAGWSPGYREKIRSTVLSDRWYRSF